GSPWRKNSFPGPGRSTIGQGGIEPGAGDGPVSFGGDRRDTQAGSGLLDRQAGEAAELDQLGLERRLPGEFVRRLVEVEQVVELVVERKGDRVEREPLLIAALLGAPLATGVINQDAAHGLGSGGEEMPPTVPVLGVLAIEQKEVRL